MRIDGTDNKAVYFDQPRNQLKRFSNPSGLPDLSFNTNVKAGQKVSYYGIYHSHAPSVAKKSPVQHLINIIESQLVLTRI
jgi:hypothetical protein